MRIRSIASVPKNRKFEYIPRYWKPEEEEKKRRKYRIHFERKTRRGQTKSILIYAFLLFLIVYFMLSF